MPKETLVAALIDDKLPEAFKDGLANQPELDMGPETPPANEDSPLTTDAEGGKEDTKKGEEPSEEGEEEPEEEDTGDEAKKAMEDGVMDAIN